MARGRLIVIDGTDGSGKHTQTMLLIERLRAGGQKAETVSFPSYGQKSAGPIEEYLAGNYSGITAEQASRLYAIDRFAKKSKLEAWLAEGVNIVTDRYVAANMGHQGGKISDPAARENFFRWCDDEEYGFWGIPRPDLTVILHVPSEIAQKRAAQRDGAKTDIHQADLNHLRNAEAVYVQMAQVVPGITLVECGEDPPERIAEKVWQTVQPLFEKQTAR